MQSTRLTLVTSITHDDTLLGHFLEYYAWLGVQRFVIAVCKNSQDLPHLRSLENASKHEIIIHHFDGTGLMTGDLPDHRSLLQQIYIKPDEWWIPADLDEFHQYPAELEALINILGQGDYTHVSGHFIDRLSPDGSLAPCVTEPSLFYQYPWETQITSRIARGSNRKVALCRGDIVVSTGHHFVHGANKRYKFRSRTHHFKWRAGLLSCLANRVHEYQQHGMTHWKESARILEYFAKYERFDLDKMDVKPGWQPY